MKNKLLLTLCVVLAFAFVLGACDGVTNGDIEYGFDQEYHWVKSDGETLKQPHVFDKGVQTKPAEGDDCGEMTYTCTVCNYKKVTSGHATESFWSSDETEHWKNATCGHNVKVDSGKHSYSPSGICLICGRFSAVAAVGADGKTEAFEYGIKFSNVEFLTEDNAHLLGMDDNMWQVVKADIVWGMLSNGNAKLIVNCLLRNKANIPVENGNDEFTQEAEYSGVLENGKLYGVITDLLRVDLDSNVLYTHRARAYLVADADELIKALANSMVGADLFNGFNTDSKTISDLATKFDAVFGAVQSKNAAEIAAVKKFLGGIVGKATTNDGDVYMVNFDSLRQISKDLQTYTLRNIFDKAFGEGFLDTLPKICDKIGEMTVKDLLSALEQRGLKVVDVLSLAQAFIDVSGSNVTLEELLYYCGIKVPDCKTVAGLLADKEVLATNVGELVGIDSVKQWLEEYLPQIKDMTPYALIAVVANDNTGGREYTADQLKSYADAFIDLAEEALGIRATVKDGVLKELRWNYAVSAKSDFEVKNDTDKWFVGALDYIRKEMARASFDVTVLPDMKIDFDPDAFVESVARYTDKFKTPTTESEALELTQALADEGEERNSAKVEQIDGQWWGSYSYTYGGGYSGTSFEGKEICSIYTVTRKINFANACFIGMYEECGDNWLMCVVFSPMIVTESIVYYVEEDGERVMLTKAQVESVGLDTSADVRYEFSSGLNFSMDINTGKLYDFDKCLHKMQLVEGETTSCKYYGKLVYECSVCHKQEVEYTRKNHEYKQTAELLPGSKSCTDGVKLTNTCTECGDTTERIEYRHIEEVVDKEIGDCGHNLYISTCPCGQGETYLAIDHDYYTNWLEGDTCGRGFGLKSSTKTSRLWVCTWCGMMVNISSINIKHTDPISDPDEFNNIVGSLHMRITYNGQTVYDGDLKVDWYKGGHVLGEKQKVTVDGEEHEYLKCICDGCDYTQLYY